MRQRHDGNILFKGTSPCALSFLFAFGVSLVRFHMKRRLPNDAQSLKWIKTQAEYKENGV